MLKKKEKSKWSTVYRYRCFACITEMMPSTLPKLVSRLRFNFYVNYTKTITKIPNAGQFHLIMP